MSTDLTIRVQALGGMFLGPDSYNGAVISIRDSSGSLLSSGFTDNGGSGERKQGATPPPGATSNQIESDGTVFWVCAVDATKDQPATVSYAANDLSSGPLSVEARIPLPPAQKDHYVKMEYEMGQPLDTPPGLVLAVAGLWVQPEFAVSGSKVKLKTKVTMMCGCEINHTPAGSKTPSPWLPSDFSVVAKIKGPKDYESEPVMLSFIVNSQFSAELDHLAPGEYTAEVTATQKSVSQNFGVARASFSIGSPEGR